MPITQDRMITLLATTKWYKDELAKLQQGIAFYYATQDYTLPMKLEAINMLAQARVPDEMMQNYANEVAHFRANAKANDARRRNLSGKRMLEKSEDGIKPRGLQPAQFIPPPPPNYSYEPTPEELATQARVQRVEEAKQRNFPKPPEVPNILIEAIDHALAKPQDSAFQSTIPFDPNDPDSFCAEEDDPETVAQNAAQEAFLERNPKFRSKE